MIRTYSITKQKDSFDIILSAVNKLVDFAKPTYGPANNNILLKRFGKVVAVDDGAFISEEFFIDNPEEQQVIDFVRSANRSTNALVGDGNITTMLILQGILQEYDNRKNSFFNNKTKDLVEEIKQASKEAVEQLKNSARQIDAQESLYDVAKISFNNSEVAKIVADIVYKIGKEGVVYIEESSSSSLSYSVMAGIEFDRGFVSHYLCTDDNSEKAELFNPVIVVTDKRLTSIAEVAPLIKKAIDNQRNIVFVCDSIDGEALEFIVENKQRRLFGDYKVLAIEAPELGERKIDFLKDLCVITGAKLITQERKMTEVNVEEFGQAEKVVSISDKTTIVGGKGNKEDLDKRVEALKDRMEVSDSSWEIDRLKKEIASLTGGIAVIRIGAPTEAEMKSLVPKIRNSVNSAQSAYKKGVIKGAALSMYELNTGSKLFDRVLKYPHKVLLDNCEEKLVEYDIDTAKNYTTGQIGDFIVVGVIDPVDVVSTAIQNAVSVALLLIKNKGIINSSNKQSYEG